MNFSGTPMIQLLIVSASSKVQTGVIDEEKRMKINAHHTVQAFPTTRRASSKDANFFKILQSILIDSIEFSIIDFDKKLVLKNQYLKNRFLINP